MVSPALVSEPLAPALPGATVPPTTDSQIVNILRMDHGDNEMRTVQVMHAYEDDKHQYVAPLGCFKVMDTYEHVAGTLAPHIEKGIGELNSINDTATPWKGGPNLLTLVGYIF
jgi:hypothetical protein